MSYTVYPHWWFIEPVRQLPVADYESISVMGSGYSTMHSDSEFGASLGEVSHVRLPMQGWLSIEENFIAVLRSSLDNISQDDLIASIALICPFDSTTARLDPGNSTI